MSVILKYAIEFPEAKFNVSNDLLHDPFTKGYLIDASIKVHMRKGAEGGTFEIELFDLPEDKASELNGKELDKSIVIIKVGYMDGDFDTVMEGVYKKVTLLVKNDKLVTTIKGEESGIFTLRNTHFQTSIKGKATIKEALTKLLKEALPASPPPSTPDPLAAVASLLGGSSASGEHLNKIPDVQKIDEKFDDLSLRGESLLGIVASLANKAGAEFLVTDKTIHIGRPIVDTGYVPKEFDRNVNLATFRPIFENLSEKAGDNRLGKLNPHQALGFKFTIAGDPKLRPGQQVSANVETEVNGKTAGYRKKHGADFRIVCLTHALSVDGGYVCEGVAGNACSAENCQRQQEALCPPNPDSIVQGIAQRGKEERRQNPTVEIGAVKEYNSGTAGNAPHRGTLYFGQRFAGTETQPSVRAEVEQKEDQLLHNKAIVSPFAWHKCGLIVPVYPGMKALLSHNLNLPDDALVTGFLWSEKPAIAPPQSKAGDWWLCLPIDFDSSSPPKDDTKAVNDLMANDGRRVIQVKGMKITVGAKALTNVGERPEDLGKEDELSIEHSSGARILLKDGEIQLTDGKVTLKISGGKVDIS